MVKTLIQNTLRKNGFTSVSLFIKLFVETLINKGRFYLENYLDFCSVFERQLRMYDGDDPLEIWDRYVSFNLQPQHTCSLYNTTVKYHILIYQRIF